MRQITGWGLLVTAAMALVTGAQTSDEQEQREEQGGPTSVGVHYLEIVCADVEAQCTALERVHGVSFGAAVEEMGGARLAETGDGNMIGVRAPMAEHEKPIIRTYLEVDDIKQAVKDAEAAGGMIAYGPVEQGDTGTWAIYFVGDIQLGLWQR